MKFSLKKLFILFSLIATFKSVYSAENNEIKTNEVQYLSCVNKETNKTYFVSSKINDADSICRMISETKATDKELVAKKILELSLTRNTKYKSTSSLPFCWGSEYSMLRSVDKSVINSNGKCVDLKLNVDCEKQITLFLKAKSADFKDAVVYKKDIRTGLPEFALWNQKNKTTVTFKDDKLNIKIETSSQKDSVKTSITTSYDFGVSTNGRVSTCKLNDLHVTTEKKDEKLITTSIKSNCSDYQSSSKTEDKENLLCAELNKFGLITKDLGSNGKLTKPNIIRTLIK